MATTWAVETALAGSDGAPRLGQRQFLASDLRISEIEAVASLVRAPPRSSSLSPPRATIGA